MPGNIASIPESVVAQWPEPNYEDPETRTWLPALAVMMLFLSTVFVVIRMSLRWKRIGGNFGLDDAFLIPAWLCAVAFAALASYSNTHGMTDRHIWDLEPGKLTQDIENAWAGMVVFVTGTSLLKISILLFYRRMVAGTFNRYWIFATWGAIALTAAYLVAFDLLLIFNCQPTRAYWMAHDPEWEAKVNYYCLDTTQVINPIAGGLSVFSDIYAIVLPCLMVQGLDMTRRQKIGLNAVFATGIFMVAGGGMRTWYLVRFGTEADITWIGFELYFWCSLEYQIGVACACAPSIRVLFQRFIRPKVRSAISRSSQSKSSKIVSRPETPNTMEHPLQPMASKRTFEPSILSTQSSFGQRPIKPTADTFGDINEVERGYSNDDGREKTLNREGNVVADQGDENGLARTESGTQAEISTSPHSTKQWLANEQYGIAL